MGSAPDGRITLRRRFLRQRHPRQFASRPAARNISAGILRQEDGEWRVSPTGDQGSGILSSMTRANCFIVLEESRGNVAAGEEVRAQLFDALSDYIFSPQCARN